MGQGILLSGSTEVDFMIHGLFSYQLFGQTVWITTSHMCILLVMLLLLIFAVGGAIAGLVLGAGGGVLLHKLVLNTEGIVTLLQLSLIGLLYTAICGSISIPLVFKFGAERARMLMFASFIAPSAIFYGIYKLLVGMGIDLTEDMIPMLLCIAPVIVVIWVAVMFKLSCYIFSKQEL